MSLIFMLIFAVSYVMIGIWASYTLYLYKSKLWMVTLFFTLAGGFLLLSIFPDFALFP